MSKQSSLSHLNSKGQANMVDVTNKSSSQRKATATGYVLMKPSTLEMITTGQHAKGDVFAVSRIAGIQAAKKCADLIPLCHPLMLSKVAVEFEPQIKSSRIKITSVCKLAGQTGVEMEALTAVSVAALTLFDMCKAVDPEMCIEGIQVESKSGGKSGDWHREQGGAD